MKRLNLNLPILDILAALAFITALLLLFVPDPARADSAACTWKTAENGNFLVRTGDCDDGLTGGYFAASTVTEKGVTTTTHNGRPSEGPRTTVEIAAN
jgi:hypothetical protein